MTHDEIEEQLDDLNDLILANATFTQWEKDFLVSVTDQFDRSGKLSEGQIEKLNEIHGRRVK